ncbi:glycosyltransferase family 4 protein [Pseudarthrobacter sp. CC4]|uniref:glycosyltransferase family 4 protein n=1 Tax=Pseudarthrobacter sp. CC4 TaxID=3029190 RepID=UPI003B8D4F38
MKQKAPESQSIKVLHLDHSHEAGGAELALVRLVTAASNWSPSILLPRSESTDERVFEKAPRHVTRSNVGPAQTPGAASQGSFARFVRFVSQILGQAVAVRTSKEFRSAEVVHANTSRSGLYGALACLGTNKKLVLQLRDQITRESLGLLGQQAFARIALRRANGIISNSKSTLETAMLLLGRREVPTAVIHSPIGIDRTEQDDPSLEPSPLRIAMIARIDPWKGQSLLLEAFACAFPDGSEELLFAGGSLFGREEFLLSLRQEVVSRGLEDRVHFLGHVDDISQVLSRVDVCVQASTRPEPLGQNVLQYLAAGKAVVASNEGGPAEWISNGVNGLLVEARDARALADALRRLSSDRDLLLKLQAEAPQTSGLLSDSEVANAHGRVFAEVLK